MIPPEVSKATLEDELEQARLHAEDSGWKLEVVEDLKLRGTIQAPERNGNRETFVFEFTFDDYPEKPPLIDVLHPDLQQRNTSNCFPEGGSNYFHEKKRICADWSRRAYGEFEGPHPEWAFTDWKQRSQPVTTIGMILQELMLALHNPSYSGRSA